MSDQVLSGGLEGAAKGFAVGGPVGAVVGGILGGISGIFGNKTAKYKRKARKEEQRAIEIQQSVQRRNLVRSAFIARSESLAAAAAQESGGLQSSASKGALSSIGSQAISNLKVFDALVARQIMQQYYMKKAGKNAGYAGMAAGLGEIGANLVGGFMQPSKSGTLASEPLPTGQSLPDFGGFELPDTLPSTRGEFPI